MAYLQHGPVFINSRGFIHRKALDHRTRGGTGKSETRHKSLCQTHARPRAPTFPGLATILSWWVRQSSRSECTLHARVASHSQVLAPRLLRPSNSVPSVPVASLLAIGEGDNCMIKRSSGSSRSAFNVKSVHIACNWQCSCRIVIDPSVRICVGRV